MSFVRQLLFALALLGTLVPGGMRWHLCACADELEGAACCAEMQDVPACCSEEPSQGCDGFGEPCERCTVVELQHADLAVVAGPLIDVASASCAWWPSVSFVASAAFVGDVEAGRAVAPVPRRPGEQSLLPLRC